MIKANFLLMINTFAGRKLASWLCSFMAPLQAYFISYISSLASNQVQTFVNCVLLMKKGPTTSHNMRSAPALRPCQTFLHSFSSFLPARARLAN